MFRRCIFDPIVCATVFISLLKCFCLNPGSFYNCSQPDLCSTSLANRQCTVHNDACECAQAQSSRNSSCDSLGQQTFLNLTGAPDINASEWTCCFCSMTGSYCCDQCNTTVSSYLRATTTFFRLLVVFILDCDKFLNEQEKLATSIRAGIANLTSSPFDRVAVENITCKTGQRPYCGVDVEHIRAHHRAKRLAVGGRVRGSSSSKKKNDRRINYYSQHGTVDLACESFSANITVHGENASFLESKLDYLRFLQKSGSLAIPLWDGQLIYSSFMLSAMKSVSYNFHEAPEPTQRPRPPTEPMQPIELDLKPLLYAAGAMLGLVVTCVLWKFIKHTWLLKKKRFTSINSDRIDPRDAQRQREVREAMEENNYTTHANRSPFNTAFKNMRGSDSEAPSQLPTWSTPASLPSMLTPAYRPTVLHNQRSPPRLILDEGSDTEKPMSIDSASTLRLDDDNLSDILYSDDEIVLRPSAGKSTSIQGRDKPTYDSDNEKSGNPKSLGLFKGSLKMSVPANDKVNRKMALQSDSDENDKTFPDLPVRKEKTKKKRDKRNKDKNAFDNNERRASLRPRANDEFLRRNSFAATGGGAKTRRVSLSPEYDEEDMLTRTGREKKPRRNSVVPEPRGSNSSTTENANLEDKRKKQKGGDEEKRKFKELDQLYKGPGKVSELNVKSVTPETKRKNSAMTEDKKRERKRKRRKEAEKISRVERQEESDQERRGSLELSFTHLEANSITKTRRKSSNVDDITRKKGKKQEAEKKKPRYTGNLRPLNETLASHV